MVGGQVAGAAVEKLMSWMFVEAVMLALVAAATWQVVAVLARLPVVVSLEPCLIAASEPVPAWLACIASASFAGAFASAFADVGVVEEASDLATEGHAAVAVSSAVSFVIVSASAAVTWAVRVWLVVQIVVAKAWVDHAWLDSVRTDESVDSVGPAAWAVMAAFAATTV
jgi:hypothetical protein